MYNPLCCHPGDFEDNWAVSADGPAYGGGAVIEHYGSAENLTTTVASRFLSNHAAGTLAHGGGFKFYHKGSVEGTDLMVTSQLANNSVNASTVSAGGGGHVEFQSAVERTRVAITANFTDNEGTHTHQTHITTPAHMVSSHTHTHTPIHPPSGWLPGWLVILLRRWASS